MSRTSRALTGVLLLGGLAAGNTLTGSTTATAADDGSQADRVSLADVRRATARYHAPAVAEAEGYLPTEHCVAEAGLGGMGLHYANPTLLADPAIDPERPEVLLYEPQPDGSLRLVAVEWFAVDPDQDLGTDTGRPELFGVPFDGPMAGHEPGMPVHFDLHAWIWKHNSAGAFANWNPDVRCPLDS